MVGELCGIFLSWAHHISDKYRVGWERGVTLIESGLRHKNYRKLLHNTLSQSASKELYPLQEAENKKFLKRLLETPENFRSHIRRTVGASIIRLAYGHEVVSDDDKYIKMAEDAQSNFSVAATPGAYWVDFIPWCEWESCCFNASS